MCQECKPHEFKVKGIREAIRCLLDNEEQLAVIRITYKKACGHMEEEFFYPKDKVCMKP